MYNRIHKSNQNSNDNDTFFFNNMLSSSSLKRKLSCNQANFVHLVRERDYAIISKHSASYNSISFLYSNKLLTVTRRNTTNVALQNEHIYYYYSFTIVTKIQSSKHQLVCLKLTFFI